MLSPETSKATASERGRAELTEVDEKDHRVSMAGVRRPGAITGPRPVSPAADWMAAR